MRVLLLHPEDSPSGGAWSREHWDLVVDLGFAGSEAYAEWSRQLNTRVISIHEFARQEAGYRWVNQIFETGRGQLLDRVGLDWWEILAMKRYQDLHTMYLFQQLRGELGKAPVELSASRRHRATGVGEQALAVAIRYFENKREGAVRRITRALRSARNLRPSQIAEISLDKWDSEYRIRRKWARHRLVKIGQPCVLVPSAYSNVTRSALAYAEQLPLRQFLLITTRSNAAPSRAPDNVIVDTLAAHVQDAKTTQKEAAGLQQAWQAFLEKMKAEVNEFRCAASAGVWNYFPADLEHGLRLREAWTSLLESEPVAGVLCGDDLNYHTRLPLILAQKKGINAVYCSHGALDGGFFFKRPFSDSYLVKGEMERDYLQRAAGVGPERILVGAPGNRGVVRARAVRGEAIVFFSQPYEVSDGRGDSIYREIIPRLASVARASGRKLIVKLHPFESKRARQELVNAALSGLSHGSIEVVDGMPPEEVMSRAWCGVTVDSSVAVEGAVREIPFFLCGWLDFTGIGYLEQFARFDVAQVLRTPDEIERIPAMVAKYRSDPAKLQRLWHEADPARLEEIMFGARQARLDPCVC